MQAPDKETLDKWQKDPNNWKWKLFYYNKEDKRLIVDKPNPIYGSTFNFAHPKSYFFLIGMMCFFGFILFMISSTHK